VEVALGYRPVSAPPPGAGQHDEWEESDNGSVTGGGVGLAKSSVVQIACPVVYEGSSSSDDQTSQKFAQVSGLRACPRVFQEFRLQAMAAAVIKVLASGAYLFWMCLYYTCKSLLPGETCACLDNLSTQNEVRRWL
jgi:hypothetical protein